MSDVPGDEQKRWECANANCGHSFVMFRDSYPTRCPLCRGETFRRIPEPVEVPDDGLIHGAYPRPIEDYQREARNLAALWANGNDGARTCILAALLRAAGSDPVARAPVAWLYEVFYRGAWTQRYSDAKPADSKLHRNLRPLYLAPQPLTAVSTSSGGE